MSIVINKERVKLYLYLAGITLLLSALIDFASDPTTALKSTVNYLWLMLNEAYGNCSALSRICSLFKGIDKSIDSPIYSR